MKLTDTEQWLVDWLNHSGWAWSPMQQFWKDRPKVVVTTFDVEKLAAAIDDRVKGKQWTRPGAPSSAD